MAILLQLPSGQTVSLESTTVTIGSDPDCNLALPEDGQIRSRHAKIRKMANKWMIESEGDWPIQVGNGVPGRKCWLKPGDEIHLTELGAKIIFNLTQPAGQVPDAENGAIGKQQAEFGAEPIAKSVGNQGAGSGPSGQPSSEAASIPTGQTQPTMPVSSKRLPPPVPNAEMPDRPTAGPPPIPPEAYPEMQAPTEVASSHTAASVQRRFREAVLSFLTIVKAAMLIIAKCTVRAKLRFFDLPRAYRALGRQVHATGSFRDDFPDLYAEIDARLQKIEELTSGNRAAQPPVTLSNKLRTLATICMNGIYALVLRRSLHRPIRNLGEAAYQRHGRQAGSPEAIRPIEALLGQIHVLGDELALISEIGRGRVITPNRLAVGMVVSGVLFGLTLLPTPHSDTQNALNNGDSTEVSRGERDVLRSERANKRRATGGALGPARISHTPCTTIEMPDFPASCIHDGEYEPERVSDRKGITHLGDKKGSMDAVSLSPTGAMVATGNRKEGIILWKVSTGAKIASRQIADSMIWCLRFSPDEQLLLVSAENHELLNTGDLSGARRLATDADRLIDPAFSPDGKTCAAVCMKSMGYNQFVQLWDVATGKKQAILRAGELNASSIAFSPRADMLAVGEEDGSISMWNWRSRKLIRSVKAHASRVLSVSFSQDGQSLLSTSKDNWCRAWKADSGTLIREVQHDDQVIFGCLLMDGGFGTVVDNTGVLHIWSIASGQQQRSAPISGGIVSLRTLEYRSGKIVAGGMYNGVQLTNLADLPRATTVRAKTVKVDDISAVDFLHGPNGEPIHMERVSRGAGEYRHISETGYFYLDAAGRKVRHGPLTFWSPEKRKTRESGFICGVRKYEQEWNEHGRPKQAEVYYGDDRHTRTLNVYGYGPGYQNGRELKETSNWRVKHVVTDTGEKTESVLHGVMTTYFAGEVRRHWQLPVGRILRMVDYRDGEAVGVMAYSPDDGTVQTQGTLRGYRQ